MNPYNYILEQYKGIRSRYNCPSCHQRHKFSRYVDKATGRQVADHVGRCDRENNCGYHYPPKQYFADNPGKDDNTQNLKLLEPAPVINRPVNYLPPDVFLKSVDQHEHCNFFQFLERLFRKPIAKILCEKFFIGSDNCGNTVFWQVDSKGQIRQAKIMEYNPITGRRNKETGAFFAGKKILGNYDANFQQCLFGEYQLSMPENINKVVAIVESEKTAVIASIYFPQFVWLATGGMNGCKWTEKEVCKVLKGRHVILFPDLGAFEKWNRKSKLLSSVAGCKVVVSNLLEKNACEADHKEGLDLADFLLREQDSSGLALTDCSNHEPYPVMLDSKL